jgi:CheY-like chemotaxis protein
MPTALVVEDDEHTRMLFHDALESVGFQTQTAVNVPDALELLKTFTPDIAFLDMNLPEHFGTEVLEHIKNTPHLSSVKTVLVTANANAEDRASDLGADLFLMKPVSIKEMLTLAQRLVAR